MATRKPELEDLSHAELVELFQAVREAYAEDDKLRVRCGDVREFIEDKVNQALYNHTQGGKKRGNS